MKRYLSNLFFIFLFVVSPAQVVATEAQTQSDDPVVLVWSELEHLKFESRSRYLNELEKIFSQWREEVGRSTFNPHLINLLAPEALAKGEEYTDVLKIGNPCIFAGNISTYSRSPRGRIWCTPPTSIKSFCGMTLKCQNPNEIPCNPLLFGFAGDNYGNYFVGRVPTSDTTKKPPEFYVSGDGSGQSNLIPQKTRVYEKPICVKPTFTATRDCASKNNSKEAYDNFVATMLLDMKKAKCSPEKNWNEFAEAAQKICDRQGNARQAEYSNKFKECDVIRERAQKLTKDYLNTDVGRELHVESLKGVQ